MKQILLVVLFVFTILVAHSSASACSDLNGDGVVNVADFLIFVDDFGKTVNCAHASIDRPKLKPKITVEPGAWGDTNLSILQTVFESVRDAFLSPLVYALDSDIIIQHNEQGPLTLYARHTNGSHIVWIDSEHRRWAQQIFQFAHEYIHILTNHRQSYPYRRQKWFEESLASLGSIYALKRLSEEWKTAPPNGDWRFQDYATNGSLERYWQNIIRDIPTQSPDNFKQWYQQNRQQLELDPYLRDKNNIVALHLLDIFENNPEAWNAIRYLNRGSLYENQYFATYLEDWYRRTPTRWQPVVTEIRTRFGVSRVYKPAVVAHRPHPPNKGQE